jgi:hypothetical protein
MSARKLASAKRVQEKKQKRLQKLRRKQSIFSFDVQKTGDRKYFISVASTLPLPAAGKD